MAGQRILVPYVRGSTPSTPAMKNLAPSSSGLGRRPLKAEIAGSNPVGATTKLQPGSISPGLFRALLILVCVFARQEGGYKGFVRELRHCCLR